MPNFHRELVSLSSSKTNNNPKVAVCFLCSRLQARQCCALQLSVCLFFQLRQSSYNRSNYLFICEFMSVYAFVIVNKLNKFFSYEGGSRLGGLPWRRLGRFNAKNIYGNIWQHPAESHQKCWEANGAAGECDTRTPWVLRRTRQKQPKTHQNE